MTRGRRARGAPARPPTTSNRCSCRVCSSRVLKESPDRRPPGATNGRPIPECLVPRAPATASAPSTIDAVAVPPTARSSPGPRARATARAPCCSDADTSRFSARSTIACSTPVGPGPREAQGRPHDVRVVDLVEVQLVPEQHVQTFRPRPAPRQRAVVAAGSSTRERPSGRPPRAAATAATPGSPAARRSADDPAWPAAPEPGPMNPANHDGNAKQERHQHERPAPATMRRGDGRTAVAAPTDPASEQALAENGLGRAREEVQRGEEHGRPARRPRRPRRRGRSCSVHIASYGPEKRIAGGMQAKSSAPAASGRDRRRGRRRVRGVARDVMRPSAPAARCRSTGTGTPSGTRAPAGGRRPPQTPPPRTS